MKLIEAKCPKCKELIEVDGDSETSKCNHCGEKIDVKDALVEKMMSEQKKEENKIVEIEKEEEIVDEVEDTEETTKEEKEVVISSKKSIKKIINTIDEEDEDLDDDDDDEDDDDDDENDDDEEEFDEDIEQEKIVEEKSNLETEKKQSAKKKLSKDKIEEKDELLIEADKLLKERKEKEAYDIYRSALDIDPSDSYCRYRINYILLRNDFYNKEKLNDLYESILKVDYCFDETGNKTDDISIVHEEFADCIVTVAWLIRKQIYDNGSQSFDTFKKKFNILYSILYVLEKFAKEDLDEEVQAKVYIYILVIINYLKDKYYYRARYTTSFQDKEHLETLKSKHSKYKGKLAKINPYYEKNYLKIFSKILDKIKDPYHKEALEEKKNSKSIMDRLDYFYDRHPVLSIILIVIFFFAFILIFAFIKDLLAGNI